METIIKTAMQGGWIPTDELKQKLVYHHIFSYDGNLTLVTARYGHRWLADSDLWQTVGSVCGWNPVNIFYEYQRFWKNVWEDGFEKAIEHLQEIINS